MFTSVRFYPTTTQPLVGQGLLVIGGSTIKLRHTTLGGTPLDEWTGRQRSLPDNTQHSQETSMPPVGFEPEIAASERPRIYAWDRAATGIGQFLFIIPTTMGWREVQFVGFYSELHSAGHTPSVNLGSASKYEPRGRRNENSRLHRTKFGRSGDLAHRIFATLMLHNIRKST